MSGTKVGVMRRKNRTPYMKIEGFPNFGGPAGGSALERASPPTKHMACRDGACRHTRRAILYSTSGGQIVAKVRGENRENLRTKMKISRDPV